MINETKISFVKIFTKRGCYKRWWTDLKRIKTDYASGFKRIAGR